MRAGVERLSKEMGQPKWFEILQAVVAAMAPYARHGVNVNVDFYSGVVYHLLGIKRDLFVPIFAIGRRAGLGRAGARAARNNILLRPLTLYNGPDARACRWRCGRIRSRRSPASTSLACPQARHGWRGQRRAKARHPLKLCPAMTRCEHLPQQKIAVLAFDEIEFPKSRDISPRNHRCRADQPICYRIENISLKERDIVRRVLRQTTNRQCISRSNVPAGHGCGRDEICKRTADGRRISPCVRRILDRRSALRSLQRLRRWRSPRSSAARPHAAGYPERPDRIDRAVGPGRRRRSSSPVSSAS
mgnify:CR=1 FL=1